jgi:hypothetical protein
MGVAGRVVCADILDLSTVQSVPANDLEQIKEKPAELRRLFGFVPQPVFARRSQGEKTHRSLMAAPKPTSGLRFAARAF